MNEKQPEPAAAGEALGESPRGTGEEAPVGASPPGAHVIPSILLEGDDPSRLEQNRHEPDELSGPPTATILPDPEAESELPQAYGTGRLLLAARDPHSLYVHWDLTAQQKRDHNGHLGPGQLLVRIHLENLNVPPIAEVRAPSATDHCFVTVQRAGATYIAQLGYYQAGGEWRTVSISQPASSPPDAPASDKSVRFATFPESRFTQPPKERSGGCPAASTPPAPQPNRAALPSFLLSASTATPEAGELPSALAGVALLPAAQTTGATTGAPAQPWTEERQRALAEYLGPAPTQLEPEPGSLNAAQFGVSSAEETLSSPLGGFLPQQKQFWLSVDAELIVYGATEPDAQLTIEGRPVQLRPDGTFSCRFALPEGRSALRLTAASAQGDVRQAELNFQRETVCNPGIPDRPD